MLVTMSTAQAVLILMDYCIIITNQLWWIIGRIFVVECRKNVDYKSTIKYIVCTISQGGIVW